MIEFVEVITRMRSSYIHSMIRGPHLSDTRFLGGAFTRVFLVIEDPFYLPLVGGDIDLRTNGTYRDCTL